MTTKQLIAYYILQIKLSHPYDVANVVGFRDLPGNIYQNTFYITSVWQSKPICVSFVNHDNCNFKQWKPKLMNLQLDWSIKL